MNMLVLTLLDAGNEFRVACDKIVGYVAGEEVGAEGGAALYLVGNHSAAVQETPDQIDRMIMEACEGGSFVRNEK